MSANGPGNMRKRTLGDFMEEKDAEQEREKLRDAATGKKRAGISSSSIQHPHMHTQSDMDCPFSSASTSSTSHVFNSVLSPSARHTPHPPNPPSVGESRLVLPLAPRHLLQAFCPLRGARRCRRSILFLLGHAQIRLHGRGFRRRYWRRGLMRRSRKKRRGRGREERREGGVLGGRRRRMERWKWRG
jgi:hypothetical protein